MSNPFHILKYYMKHASKTRQYNIFFAIFSKKQNSLLKIKQPGNKMSKQSIQEHIANKINDLIRDKEISLRALSDKSGISPGHISKVLTCKVNPTVVILQQFALALDVPISYFFDSFSNKKMPATKKNNNQKHYKVCILSVGSKRLVHIHDDEHDYGYLEMYANITLYNSVNVSLEKIKESIFALLNKNGITNFDYKYCDVVISAQCYEYTSVKDKLLDAASRIFASLEIVADWQITYFSSFKFKNGISIVIDKGMSASYRHQDKLYKIGGWGFPHDVSGEYWIGLQAVQHVFKVIDGLEKKTVLFKNIISKFNNDPTVFVEYCSSKNLNVYAELADIVLSHVALDEKQATSIINKGFEHIKTIIAKIDIKTGISDTPITLHGSIADIYKGFLPKERYKKSPSIKDQCKMLSLLAQKTEELA